MDNPKNLTLLKVSLFQRFCSKGLISGALGGLMSGMLGASGTPPILAGLDSMGLSSLEVVGTSVMVLFFIALTGVVTHSAFGTLNWLLVILLASGTITGAIIGPLLGKRINKKTMENSMARFLLFYSINGNFDVLLISFTPIYRDAKLSCPCLL